MKAEEQERLTKEKEAQEAESHRAKLEDEAIQFEIKKKLEWKTKLAKCDSGDHEDLVKHVTDYEEHKEAADEAVKAILEDDSIPDTPPVENKERVALS